jgi:hypothetical protein
MILRFDTAGGPFQSLHVEFDVSVIGVNNSTSDLGNDGFSVSFAEVRIFTIEHVSRF